MSPPTWSPSQNITPVQWDLSQLSGLQLEDKTKQQHETQLKLQSQKSWTNIQGVFLPGYFWAIPISLKLPWDVLTLKKAYLGKLWLW